ncbi:augmin complex subunit dgt3 [Thrips palmi]|uniref:Augmin complex subunit dgt3 n=1 Tax=Thrips palmi TaxID=161013 RepID=A0A6P8ZJT8_THRPL|nr:augmin complex subunit dgt3 [Thrips palmi]
MAELLEKFSSFHCDVDGLSPNEVKWLSEVTELSAFLEWFMKYTDNSNCLDKIQFRKYNELCQDGDQLYGQALDEALGEFGIDVNKCMSSNLSQLDLELLDKELDELRTQNDVGHEIETLLSEEIQKLSLKEHANEAKLKAAQAFCQKEGQNLMKINVPLKATMTNLFSNFSKLVLSLKDSNVPDVQNCLMSNMPLENIINKCDKFNEYANLYIKRNFEQCARSEKTINELMSFLEEDSSMRSAMSSSDMTSGLPHKMWKVEIGRISMQGTLVGYSTAMNTLSKLKESGLLEKYNVLQMKVDLTKLQEEISRLTDDIELLVRHEVHNMAEHIVLQHIYSVVENITRARIERRQISLRKLCIAANVTHKILYLTDLIWMLMLQESHKFKFGTDLLKEITEYFTDELNKHNTVMNNLNIISNEYASYSEALRPGQAALVSTVQKLLEISVDNFDSGNGTSSEHHLKELEQIQLSTILEPFNHTGRENSVYELLSYLSDGPTKKPNLVSKDLYLAMEEVECQLNNYNREIQKLDTTFSSKQLAFKKYPVLKNRRLLWAWFLVAPHELEKAVMQVEESAKRKK